MEDLTANIMNMMFNLQDLKIQQKYNAAKMPEKDSYGYPFEPFDAFSTEPASFLEKAMMLDSEAVEVFKQLRELNRHSPLFYQMSSDMEKIVSQLGSVCITKAVIEQQGENSSSMDQLLNRLTIDHLREWTAFNLRKCFASYMESSSVLHYNRMALNLSLRWSALDKRLLATAEKIEKIKSGLLKVDLTDKAEELKKEVSSTEQPNEKTEKNAAPLRDNGCALPVDKAAVRDSIAEAAQEIVTESGEKEISEATAQTLPHEDIPAVADPDQIPVSAETIAPSDEAELSEHDTPTEYTDEDEDESDEQPLPIGNQYWMQDMAALFSDPNLMKWVVPEYASPP